MTSQIPEQFVIPLRWPKEKHILHTSRIFNNYTRLLINSSLSKLNSTVISYTPVTNLFLNCSHFTDLWVVFFSSFHSSCNFIRFNKAYFLFSGCGTILFLSHFCQKLHILEAFFFGHFLCTLSEDSCAAKFVYLNQLAYKASYLWYCKHCMQSGTPRTYLSNIEGYYFPEFVFFCNYTIWYNNKNIDLNKIWIKYS